MKDDVIYRQAAIDEIARWIGYLDKDMISRIQIGLERLPSAQSEIIRCKDCLKYDAHGHRCKHWNHAVVVMDWCSRAERRTDDGE